MRGLKWQTSTAWFRLVLLAFSPFLVQLLWSMSAYKGLTIPAMDINTTCTSFVSALSTVSYLSIEGGEYQRVLIVSSEVGSLGWIPKQKKALNCLVMELQPLFFEATKEDKGIIASMQRTWSEGAHDTGNSWWFDSVSSEIVLLKQPRLISCFDMKGKKILLLSARVIPDMFQEFQDKGRPIACWCRLYHSSPS